MKPFLAVILPVWSYVHFVTASSSNMTTYRPAELRSEVSHTFLTCLRNTGVQYKVYVDNGATVVIPMTKRDIDLDGIDKKLLECIIHVNHLMHVVVESALYDQDEHANAVAGHSVTHEWLSTQGANGLVEVALNLLNNPCYQ